MGAEKAAVADEIFDRLDADGDGTVVADDYRANAERLLQSYGMGPSSPKGRALIEASLALWERQAEMVDRDRDGRIGREEYREWFAALAAAEAGSGAAALSATQADAGTAADTAAGLPTGVLEVMAVLHAQFTVADRDGDGRMDSHEYTVWRSLRSVPAEVAAASFGLIDADGDGVITWDDFVAAERRHGFALLWFGP
ncbi:EF-hand domain-containing protein [Streptomyces sp. NPDC048603]|uniref:EF-hand domain-containing protein n=1 Tax=Streptomyces sp. NPDC048603 TaxID=3365577 RepID=UPI003711A832